MSCKMKTFVLAQETPTPFSTYKFVWFGIRVFFFDWGEGQRDGSYGSQGIFNKSWRTKFSKKPNLPLVGTITVVRGNPSSHSHARASTEQSEPSYPISYSSIASWSLQFLRMEGCISSISHHLSSLTSTPVLTCFSSTETTSWIRTA